MNRRGCDLPGYVKVNTLRNYWKSAEEFDNHLHQTILQTEMIKEQEHHQIWVFFQDKFMMTNELYNHAKFFEMILYRACKD